MPRSTSADVGQVAAWRKDGVGWKEIASRTGVSAAAWRRRLRLEGGVSAGPRPGAPGLSQVEAALYRLCVGGAATEEKVVRETAQKGESVRVERVSRRVEPDLKAIQWWLERRMPERWREGGSGEVQVVLQVPRPEGARNGQDGA